MNQRGCPKMSRYATAILGMIVVTHLVGYASTTKAEPENPLSPSDTHNLRRDLDGSKRSQDYLLDGQATNLRAPRARQSTNNLVDLIELTPSLEQQLNQAKRLNGADSGSSVIDLSRLVNDAAYRYDIAAASDMPATNNRPVGAQSRFSRQWMDGVQMLSGLRRFTDHNDADEAQTRRFSRGLTPVYDRAEAPPMNGEAAFGREQQDKDYGTLVSVSSPVSIDNQENASRRSLWPPELLRDLLIAQEARNRARSIEKLARAHGRDRGANQNAISIVGQGAASNREKRRRCKVDPNLGVKNPSFCDTDAYFGAADYGMRDVWDSAGR